MELLEEDLSRFRGIAAPPPAAPAPAFATGGTAAAPHRAALPLPLAVELGVAMIDAIEGLHRNGYLQRDIKVRRREWTVVLLGEGGAWGIGSERGDGVFI